MEGSSTGGSHCRRPFEAKQRRHRRSMPSKTGFRPRTAWQPSLQLSTVSSSSSIMYFSFYQGVFLNSLKVYFSDSVSMSSNTSFEPFLPGSPLSTSPHSSFSKLYFSDISLSKCISLILQSVFLRLPKLQPETICRVPAASISPAALFLTGPSCFSRC